MGLSYVQNSLAGKRGRAHTLDMQLTYVVKAVKITENFELRTLNRSTRTGEAALRIREILQKRGYAAEIRVVIQPSLAIRA